MNKAILRAQWVLMFIFVFGSLMGQPEMHFAHKHNHDEKPLFIKNENQWHENIQYKTGFNGSVSLFLENSGFTYLLSNPEDLKKVHDLSLTDHKKLADLMIRHHAYKVHFLGAQEPIISGNHPEEFYHSYFFGKDPSKWASKVPLVEEVKYENLYDKIDLLAYSQEGHFKYDFIVNPGGNVSNLKLKYEGTDEVKLVYGDLKIKTSIHEIIEQKPYAYQIIDSKKRVVKCNYALENDILSFDFPEGYDSKYQLIIDPTVVAATLSGTSISQNFGHSATYDNAGNMYTAGRSFGSGYPATTGAFQLSYAGGASDIVVSKYNQTGSNLIYATYIGGTGEDLPHSIITDFNDQLYIYGSSSSINYPTTINAFQTDNSGNSEIIITILNDDGSELVGSSYYGGSNDDGINNSTLNANYGDNFRGEIILDSQNNIYVISSTGSSDFPVTSNAFDQSFNNVGGGIFVQPQDAVVLKANSDLSVLFWATYLGGDRPDIGNGIRVDDFGNVYVTGTAGASNFPTNSNAVKPNWPGGQENAYVAVLSPNGSNLISSTFWGSNGDEHSYFIDLDDDNNVHIYGQSTGGNMPVTPMTYSNPNSRQFISAFNQDLTEIVYSTIVGTGNSFSVDFVPVAFMVDKCNGIYFSGYEAAGGLPLTADFIDNAPGTFYLGVLEELATDLTFGTYYGDADHVDGGTSRFDKAGVVYQGVCSCTFTGILNTLPGAWAPNQSTQCDVGGFKIDFNLNTMTAKGTANPSASGCAPFDVAFQYTGQNATSWFWDFGDGSTSTLMNPNYTFVDGGSYEVMLITENPDACNPVDTSFLTVDVLDNQAEIIDTVMCGNTQIFLDATTQNATYAWQDGTTGATYTASTPGTYWVEVTITGCSKIDSFIVAPASQLDIDLGEDQSVCNQSSILIEGEDPGAVSYLWNNGTTGSSLNVTNTGVYWLETIDTIGCVLRDSIEILFGVTPSPDLGIDTTLCHQDELNLTTPGTGVTYLWSNGSINEDLTISQPGIYWVELDNNGCSKRDSIEISYFPQLSVAVDGMDILCANDCNGISEAFPTGGSSSGYTYIWNTTETEQMIENLCPATYEVTITDDRGCEGAAQFTINAPPPLEMSITTQDVECPNDSDGAIEITTVDGGVPFYMYSVNNEAFTEINGKAGLPGGNYLVQVMDANGCLVIDTIFINEPVGYAIDAGPNKKILLGESAQLNAIVLPVLDQEISWTPPDFLDCPTCPSSGLRPTETTLYTLTVTDPQSGCFLADSVLIQVEPIKEIYIPNAFSPNGDGNNDSFIIYGGNAVEQILDFKIFDRWGELLFENQNFLPNDPNQGWNGYYNGKTVNPSVLTYFVKVQFIDGTEEFFSGGITLLR